VVTGDQNVKISRSIIVIRRKGSTALLTPATVSLDIPAETMRQIPNGGVSIPIARFVTTTTPI